MPMGRFFNNSVHSNGRFGLWIFPGYHPTVSGACDDLNPSPAVFDTFVSSLSTKGAEWVMANPMQFKNFVVFDHFETGIEAKTTVFAKNFNTPYASTFFTQHGPIIQNSLIIGNSDSSSSQSISESGKSII